MSFLRPKGEAEREHRPIKQLRAFDANRISVRFAYELHDHAGAWFRAYGNEQWLFDPNGLMRRREASINDLPIDEADRLFRWPSGPRPAGHPGLFGLDL